MRSLVWLGVCLACSPLPTASGVPHTKSPPAADASPVSSGAAEEALTDDSVTDDSVTDAPTEGAAVEPLVTQLELTDVPPPILVLPATRQPVPLLIGAHGAGGSPEWQCGWLSSLAVEPMGLLCLRGLPLSRHDMAFYYPEHHSLGRWLATALEHTQTNYAQRLQQPFIYVGYSQGATMGALAIQVQPSPVAHLLLVEGGLEGWSAKRAGDFARAGGQMVYFACGTHSCNTRARKLEPVLTRAGIQVRVGYAEGAGHTPMGAVEDYVREGLAWLLAGPSTR